jgi:hypothetical protein
MSGCRLLHPQPEDMLCRGETELKVHNLFYVSGVKRHCTSICFRMLHALIPVAAPSKVRMVLGPSNTGIVDINPARGSDVCPHFCVLCCLV